MQHFFSEVGNISFPLLRRYEEKIAPLLSSSSPFLKFTETVPDANDKSKCRFLIWTHMDFLKTIRYLLSLQMEKDGRLSFPGEDCVSPSLLSGK